MSEFKEYRRKQIAELRPVTQNDIEHYKAQSSNQVKQISYGK